MRHSIRCIFLRFHIQNYKILCKDFCSGIIHIILIHYRYFTISNYGMLPESQGNRGYIFLQFRTIVFQINQWYTRVCISWSIKYNALFSSLKWVYIRQWHMIHFNGFFHKFYSAFLQVNNLTSMLIARPNIAIEILTIIFVASASVLFSPKIFSYYKSSLDQLSSLRGLPKLFQIDR